jgi:hypothetical protein
MAPRTLRQCPFWAAGAPADAAIRGQVIDAHGEQNGAIYQEVALSRSDIAPVSMLAHGRADVLECLVNGKYGNHSSHLHPRHTARDAWSGQGLWSSRGPPSGQHGIRINTPVSCALTVLTALFRLVTSDSTERLDDELRGEHLGRSGGSGIRFIALIAASCNPRLAPRVLDSTLRRSSEIHPAPGDDGVGPGEPILICGFHQADPWTG